MHDVDGILAATSQIEFAIWNLPQEFEWGPINRSCVWLGRCKKEIRSIARNKIFFKERDKLTTPNLVHAPHA